MFRIFITDDSPHLGDIRNPSIQLAKLDIVCANDKLKPILEALRIIYPSDYIKIATYEVEEKHNLISKSGGDPEWVFKDNKWVKL